MHSAAQATSAPKGKPDKEAKEGERGIIMPPPNPKALVDMIEVMVSPVLIVTNLFINLFININ